MKIVTNMSYEKLQKSRFQDNLMNLNTNIEKMKLNKQEKHLKLRKNEK